MRELIPTIQNWLTSGKRIALATVIKVEGSSPRPVGAKLVVSSKGELIGSVSGGCVEGSVIEEALQCLQSGKPKILHYGIDNSSPWSVGLACGGKIDVFIEPLFSSTLKDGFNNSIFKKIIELLKENQPFVIATFITGNPQGVKGLFVNEKWVNNDTIHNWLKIFPVRDMKELIQAGKPHLVEIEIESPQPTKVFLEPVLPQARMVIIGAVHIAAALVNFAHELGYRTIVIDPRSAFLTRDRFPLADEMIHAWPQDCLPKLNLVHSDCVAVLSHDEKIDVPALMEALKSPVRYIGLLGSLKTKNERFLTLKTEGVTEQELERIHAPIGLNIGAQEPEEIALSIIAEIISGQRKKGS
jgi:xanthine dehydrogenase accessory factor